jgi:sulfite reductase (NADPH) flavoprotein alpha-component
MTATTAVPLPLGPLDPERSELLRRVVDGLEPVSLHWLSGFTAGVAYARGHGGVAAAVDIPVAAAPSVAPRGEAIARFAVVYGSQTGNGRRIAERLGRAAEAAGLAVRVHAARDYPLKDLAKERLLTVVVSTHGDGDPPDDARGFVEHLAGKRAPRLESLAYSVLALGDSSYPKFCETGRQVDERLAALGGRRLLPRVDCDLDYERLVTPWLEQVVAGARDALGTAPAANVTRLRSRSSPRFSPTTGSPVAARRRTCATSSCRSRVRAWSTNPATRWGSGTRTRPSSWTPCWRQSARRARNPWPPMVSSAVCANGWFRDARPRD